MEFNLRTLFLFKGGTLRLTKHGHESLYVNCLIHLIVMGGVLDDNTFNFIFTNSVASVDNEPGVNIPSVSDFEHIWHHGIVETFRLKSVSWYCNLEFV